MIKEEIRRQKQEELYEEMLREKELKDKIKNDLNELNKK